MVYSTDQDRADGIPEGAYSAKSGWVDDTTGASRVTGAEFANLIVTLANSPFDSPSTGTEVWTE